MKRPVLALVLVVLGGLTLAAAQQHAPAQPQPQQSQPPQQGQQAQPTPSQDLVDASEASTEGDAAQAQDAAQGDEHAEDAEAKFKYSPSVRWMANKLGVTKETAYWIALILNFVVIAAVIVWIVRKRAPGAFRERTALIRKQLEEARAASEEANRRLSDIEGRLARLDSELAELRSQAEREAAAEEQRLRAATEEEKHKIIATAEQEIASAGKLARAELKRYAAELAVGLAEKKIEVTPAADQALVRTFVEQLSGEKRS